MNDSESYILNKKSYNIVFKIINAVERARNYSLLMKYVEQNKSIVHCIL